MSNVTSSSLRDLIQTAMDSRRWTTADLHRATKRLDPGGKGVAYSSLAAWMNPETPSGGLPRLRNLDLVARALGLDAAEVRSAAGYRAEESAPLDPAIQVFVADVQKMPAAERARLMRIVQATMNDPDLFPSRRRNGG